MHRSPFSTIAAALQDMRAGRMVVVCDAEDRQNEGDLVQAAQFATPRSINFMATHGRGLVCLALTAQRCDELGLEPMAPCNESRFGTAFMISVEARAGVGTGISARDRARTIQVAIGPGSGSAELTRPGHMFPLAARPGGVLERAGHTEASVDLARLAGLRPAAAICPVMNDDGSMARVPDLERYCATHGLSMVSIADVVAHRHRHERLVERVAETAMPTRFGAVEAIGYRSVLDGAHHLALVKGEVRGGEHVLVRVHPERRTGDAFGALLRDCGLLDDPLAAVAAEGRGVVLRLAARDDGIAAQILADLGLASVRLLTNDLSAVAGLERSGLRVTGCVPLALGNGPQRREDDRGRPYLELVAGG